MHPYIIGVTASALASDRERCLAAGMNEHLGKPVRLAQLVDAFERACQAMAGAAGLRGVAAAEPITTES